MKKGFELQVANEVLLKGFIYEPESEKIGIVQICHGMAEHIKRYDNFMQYLCDNNFVVIGHDLVTKPPVLLINPLIHYHI